MAELQNLTLTERFAVHLVATVDKPGKHRPGRQDDLAGRAVSGVSEMSRLTVTAAVSAGGPVALGSRASVGALTLAAVRVREVLAARPMARTVVGMAVAAVAVQPARLKLETQTEATAVMAS